MRAAISFTAILGLISFAGCAGGLAPTEPKGLKEKMVDVAPLTGTVVLDGTAPSQLVMTAFNAKEVDAWKGLDTPRNPNDPIRGTVTASIKPDGTFSFQTYKAGDGLPIGEWIVLFCRPGKGNESFNKKYNDPINSKFRAKLEKDKPVDLGKVELSTKK